MIFALAGNPNCGKTTLFNTLTGANQHVGNFPGVTVEQKTGPIRGTAHLAVDLPGIYSLRPYSRDESVARDFLLRQRPDAIINLVDATHPERNLYLTLQLLTLGIPTVIALNMIDALHGSRGSVDTTGLSAALGVPVVPISAARGEGIAGLVEAVTRTAQARRTPQPPAFCPDGPLRRCIRTIRALAEPAARRAGICPDFCAEKLLEGDRDVEKLLRLSRAEKERLEAATARMEREAGMDRNAAMADMRYRFIQDLCRRCFTRGQKTDGQTRSMKIDRVLTHRFFALPIFAAIMAGVFFLTFHGIGAKLSRLLNASLNGLTQFAGRWLAARGVHPVVRSLITDGIFSGVGSVLGFLPLIVTLFFFLSLLEDSGYMARAAFLLDAPLRRIGLSGRSFVPLVMGFGCSVPAIMAARTIPGERSRNLTILLTPFMSCSAKLPIYTVFATAFFPGHEAAVMLTLYFGGMAAAAGLALLLKGSPLRGESTPFVLELPNYRLPSLRNVLLLMEEKALDFLRRAFTVIFAASVLIWFLQTFDLHLRAAPDRSESILAAVGTLVAPVFAPLGFGDWRAVTALLSGLTAKETVVSTLGVVLGCGAGQLSSALPRLFTPLSACSYLCFCLLYTPCVASVATIRRETHSLRKALTIAFFQCALAWLAALLVYRVGGKLPWV